MRMGRNVAAGSDRAKDPFGRARLAVAVALSGDEAMEGPGRERGAVSSAEMVAQRAVTDAAKAAGIGK